MQQLLVSFPGVYYLLDLYRIVKQPIELFLKSSLVHIRVKFGPVVPVKKPLALPLNLSNPFPFLPIVHNKRSQALLALDNPQLVIQLVDGLVHPELVVIDPVLDIQALGLELPDHSLVDLALVLQEHPVDLRIDILLVLQQLGVHFLDQSLLELPDFPLHSPMGTSRWAHSSNYLILLRQPSLTSLRASCRFMYRGLEDSR